MNTYMMVYDGVYVTFSFGWTVVIKKWAVNIYSISYNYTFIYVLVFYSWKCIDLATIQFIKLYKIMYYILNIINIIILNILNLKFSQ